MSVGHHFKSISLSSFFHLQSNARFWDLFAVLINNSILNGVIGIEKTSASVQMFVCKKEFDSPIFSKRENQPVFYIFSFSFQRSRIWVSQQQLSLTSQSTFFCSPKKNPRRAQLLFECTVTWSYNIRRLKHLDGRCITNLLPLITCKFVTVYRGEISSWNEFYWFEMNGYCPWLYRERCLFCWYDPILIISFDSILLFMLVHSESGLKTK